MGVKIEPTERAKSPPKGTVYVPKSDSYRFKVSGTELEPMPQDLINMNVTTEGVDVQFPWEDYPRREHDHVMSVGPFYMDKDLVTNARYAEYLKDTKYKPKDSRAFQH